MRKFQGRLAAMVAAGLWWSWSPSVHAVADEPYKPSASASETNPAVPAAGHSIHGEAFNDGPRRRAVLMPGMGKAQFAVTTKSPEAQSFINQGVGQLHSFFYLEAERSFRQAAKIDPDCVMAYWGMAMSNVNNPNRARGFLKKARDRTKKLKISRREQLYIDALEAFHAEGGKDKEKARRQALVTGLETIVQDFPDDIDALAWLAMVTWQNSDRDGIGSRQAVDFLIDRVLDVEPMHPGAHHYRIHLWDSTKAIRAERSAATFAKTAPGIAHAWHMPGHTYTNLKRFADAAYQQEGSARVDHAYMARERVMPFEIHNYAHNNQWLCTSDSHVGRVHDAIAVARNLVEQPRDPRKNGPNDGGSSQRSGRLRWVELLIRYELWDDLIAADASGALDWSNIPIERKEKAYSLGLAYAAKNDTAKLEEQIKVLKGIVADESKGSSGSSATPKPSEPALAELEGRAALAKGEIASAFEHFAKARSMRDEALARAHLAVRNFGFAETVAKKAVDQAPGQLPPLAALVEILQAVGKDKDAQDAFHRLEPLLEKADRDLPVLRRLEPIVARWKTEGTWKPAEPPPPKATEETAIDRIDLSTLGPLVWSPFPALPISGVDTTGKSWSLADLSGKTTIVVFFLGGKCAHCMQQLQLFGKEYQALKNANVGMLAISTDAAEGCRELKNNADGVSFPMPMLADPGLENFHRWGAFDDFEDQPLHGTVLIDAQGGVRFQNISADPFLEIEFLKTEAARVIRLLDQPKPPTAG